MTDVLQKLEKFQECQTNLSLARQKVEKKKVEIENNLKKKSKKIKEEEFKELLDKLNKENEKLIKYYIEQRDSLYEYRLSFLKKLKEELVKEKDKVKEEPILSNLGKYPYLGLPVKVPDAVFEENIDRKDLIKGNLIGEGSFGVVYRALCNGTEVAVKELKDIGGKFNLENEATTLKALTHENVLRFLGFVQAGNGQPAALVIEYVSRTSLDKILFPENNAKQKYKFSFRRKMIIASEIANGMKYLHKQDIVHLDLKTANILVDEDFHIRIADFGLSRVIGNQHLINSVAGTPVYMAPELFVSSPRVSPQCDVYSFGVVLWELVTECKPTEYYQKKLKDSAKDFVQLLIKDEDTLKLPIEEKDFIPEYAVTDTDKDKGKKELIPTVAETLKNVLKSCLQKDPEKRYYKKPHKDRESHEDSCFTELCDSENNVWHQAASDLVASGYKIIQQFWSRVKKENAKQVLWEDFKRELALLINKSSNVENMETEFEALHALLGVHKTGDEDQYVTEEAFYRFLKWFPFFNEDKENLLKNVLDMVSQPWWFGDVTEKKANVLLKNEDPGTFLIRYSSSLEGKFVISFVKEESVKGQRTVVHQRFSLDPKDPIFLKCKKLNGKSKVSIITAVNEITKNNLTSPVPCTQKPSEFAKFIPSSSGFFSFFKGKEKKEKKQKKKRNSGNAYAYVDDDQNTMDMDSDDKKVSAKDAKHAATTDDRISDSNTSNFEYID